MIPITPMFRHQLQLAAWVELAICWVAWLMAFIQPNRLAAGQEKVARAPASRLGIFFNLLGFACMGIRVRPAGLEQPLFALVASMLLAPPSVILAWAATRELGAHWHFEAALNEYHELVTTGPYSRLRHPIYSSMLGMLLASGAAYTWWPLLATGLVLFLIGTGIRISAEDRLLYERFQDEFVEYRDRVPATLIPRLRR